MKMRLSDLPPGSCFKQGKTVKKKLSDGRVVTVGAKGRVRIAEPKGDPVVASVSCELKLLGVGLRRHPEQIVEMGSGRPVRIQDRKLR